jgi:hypothetical protein
MADVRRGHLGQEDSNYHLRDLCPQEGVLSSRLSESNRVTSALKRGVSPTGDEPRPELDIDLNLGAIRVKES